MKTRTLLALAATVVAVGCSKSDPGGSSGAAGAVSVKAVDAQFNGDYDHGLYVKRSDGATLVLARGCPSIGCDSVDAYGNGNDSVKKSCATGVVLVADFPDRGDGKVGDNTATIDVTAGNGESTTITGRTPVAKLKITELGADSVTGTIDYKSDHDTFAKGPFKAKVCQKK